MSTPFLKAGLHADIPHERYHADPAPEPSLSHSIIKVLLEQTPAHAWHAHPRLNPEHARDFARKYDIGNGAHALTLEGRAADFVIIGEKDYRKNAATEARDTAIKRKGIPILGHEWDKVSAMHHARVDWSFAALGFDPFARTTGTPEATIITQISGIWVRCRVDFLPKEGRLFWDYKTTKSADFVSLKRKVFDLGYDTQEAWYRRLIRYATDRKMTGRFLFQETDPPYACAMYEFDDETIREADARCDKALTAWRYCLENDRWPAYPPFANVVRAPEYLAYQRLEQEALLERMTAKND